MTNHLARLYAAAGTIIVFFLLWVTVAAHPWATTEQVTPQDPRLVALAQREKRLQKRAADAKRIVDRRWAVYERRAALREWQNTVALQQHVQQVEASRAAAVRVAQAAVAETARARAYAASVVAWANQQLRAAGSTTAVSATAGSAPAPATTGRRAAPTSGRSSVAAPANPPTSASPGAPVAAAPVPAPAAQPAAAATPVAAPTPALAPAPVATPPPVQVVTLPPVTTTKVSKKK